MAYGMQALGDSGGILFDSNDAAFSLASSGSLTTSRNAEFFVASIPLPSPDSLVFVRCVEPVAQYTVNANYCVVISRFAPVSFDYRIYIPASQLGGAGGYGIETYGGSGRVIYSSRVRPLSFGYIGTATRNIGGFSITHGVPGGFVCLSPFSHSWVKFGGREGNAYLSNRYAFGVTCGDSAVIGANFLSQVFYIGSPYYSPDPLEGAVIPILIAAP